MSRARSMKIELLYVDDCPGHAELRKRLPALLEQAGLDARIEDRRIGSEDAARAERFLGSPTLRINGRDVDAPTQAAEDYGLRCRLYPSAEGLRPRPSDALITRALRAARPSTQRLRVESPARNRVTPIGDIEAIPLRGAWTGNRGILHSGSEIVRFHASDLWITCALQFRGRWHEQWQPHHFTFLYFHDEAVSFAAGHRPCAECRRDDYNAYRAAWAEALGVALPSAKLMNQQLHGERIVRGTHRRRVHAAVLGRPARRHLCAARSTRRPSS